MPYSFEKLDQVFLPDYTFPAMDNVGCIVYTDKYIEKDEVFSEYKK